jgi:hypothetical protein
MNETLFCFQLFSFFFLLIVGYPTSIKVEGSKDWSSISILPQAAFCSAIAD